MRKKMDTDVNLLRELGYESRDVSLSALVKLAFWFFVFLVGSALVTLVIYGILAPGEIGKTPKVAPIKLPPGQPPLQTGIAAKKDIEVLRAEENARLTQYGWVDRQKQIVHIPIERAMEMVLQKGLPTATSAQSTPQGKIK
jgi:hypothetical protein